MVRLKGVRMEQKISGETEDPDNLTAEEIGAIRAGIKRGLEAAAEGRIKSLTQVVDEARQRHGFPATWANDVDGTT